MDTSIFWVSISPLKSARSRICTKRVCVCAPFYGYCYICLVWRDVLLGWTCESQVCRTRRFVLYAFGKRVRMELSDWCIMLAKLCVCVCFFYTFLLLFIYILYSINTINPRESTNEKLQFILLCVQDQLTEN